MALTRSFKEKILARAKIDPSFRKALLTEALELLIAGDVVIAKSTFRDYINATIGFEKLAEQVGKSSKSLMRMFSLEGNPQLNNFIEILSKLQSYEGVTYEVKEAVTQEENDEIEAMEIISPMPTVGTHHSWITVPNAKSRALAFRGRAPAVETPGYALRYGG